jgi:ketosteroid isomerase-like protein
MRSNQKAFPATTSALRSLVVIFLMFTTAIIASAQQSNPSLRTAIGARADEFMAVFARGDGAGVAALYSQQAHLFPPNASAIKGRAGIQTFWQGAIDSGLKQIKLEITEVHGMGGMAVEVGTFSVLGANDQVVDTGKYIVVWKRERGKWMLYRDIWNSNTPART